MERKDRIGAEILKNSRMELYDFFPFLDGAFASVCYVPDPEEKTIRTDGENFFFSSDFLIREYIRNQKRILRGYLHILLHCLYLHPWTDQNDEDPLWDLSCDIAVEVLIENSNLEGLSCQEDSLRSSVLNMFRERSVGVHQIYQKLLNGEIPGETKQLEELFCFDDHSSWKNLEEERKGKMRRKWERIHIFSGDRQSRSNQPGSNPGEETEIVDDFTKSRYDYGRFLKQFTVRKEEVELDLESFDYIYYHLGIERYGNIPLIEPLEYKEVNRLEELVIAIDTSSSCSTEVVQQFLTETYQMLSQKENFFRKMKVYLIQCDTHIEDVTVIHSEEEWKQYSSGITICGRGGTDFRPVFSYVEELQKQQEIRNLKGLLYFTDGDGVFPREKPTYETAFVFLKEKAKLDYVPSWAQILLI